MELTKKRIEKFDTILNERGLCRGKGSPTGVMCIESLISIVMDLPFGDRPTCVTDEIISFKIALNDKNWSSNQARAKGLRDLGIAQIGSKGIVKGSEFLSLLQSKIIKILIPNLFRKVLKGKFEAEIIQCENFPTRENCLILRNFAADAAAAADAAYAAYADAAAAAYAAYAADAAAAAAAYADAYTDAYADADYYLIMCANLALEVLKELKSPGCEWL